MGKIRPIAKIGLLKTIKCQTYIQRSFKAANQQFMQQKEKDNRRLKTFLKRAKSKKKTKVGLRVRPAMLVALKMIIHISSKSESRISEFQWHVFRVTSVTINGRLSIKTY